MLELKRLYRIKQGIFGVMAYNDQPQCVTFELPWKMNSYSISCIPVGLYSYCKYDSTKFGTTCISLTGVHSRAGIAIHPGNSFKDTDGCILVGQSFYSPMILNSRIALRQLLDIIPAIGQIQIKEYF